jgi:hypothetical protein
MGTRKVLKITMPEVPRTSTSNNWRRKKEERDPDAMDVDAMSTGKRNYLMKKGACFICEEPRHRAKEHNDSVKKRDERRRGKQKRTPRRRISEHSIPYSKGYPKQRKKNFCQCPPKNPLEKTRRRKKKRPTVKTRIFKEENYINGSVSYIPIYS